MKALTLLLALNDMEDEFLLDALEERPRQTRKFRPGLLLIAAILGGLLAVSVGAAITEAGWFQQFFQVQTGQDLTQGQTGVILEGTKESGQSVTRDGYTIALDSVIADARHCYIKVRITAPQGVTLDNENGYGPRAPKSVEDLRIDFVNTDGKEFSGMGMLENLEDEDPKDGQVTLMYRYVVREDAQTTFETDRSWRLTIRDLAAWGDRGEEDTILVKGDVSFDIRFDKLSCGQLRFVSEPVPYSFTLPGGAGVAEGTITSCVLQPMSGSLQISGCDEAAGFNRLPVVMKDGTQVELCSNIWGNGSYTYTLKAPIDLEEVDHILLEDGRKLYPAAD